MKKVEAIVTPRILDAVREVLNEYGCHEIVLSEVRISRNNSSSAAGHYRGNAYEIHLPKVKVETIVADADAMPAAQAILRASRLQSSTDPEISVCSLDEVISIGVSTVECDKPRMSGTRSRIMLQRPSRAEALHA